MYLYNRMKKFYYIFIFSLLIFQNSFALESSNPSKKDTTKNTGIIFSVGGGMIYTSLNFFKNYQEETYYRGGGGRIMMQLSDRFRISANIEQVKSINIQPIWLNVNNIFYDLDAHFLMHFADGKSIAYFIMGASAQYWKGFYTGIHDLNSWKLNTPPNSNYQALYYGATLGMGAEVKIAGPLSIYGEFRFRISKTDVGTGLNDVLYSAGLKINLPTLKPKTGKHHSILKFRDKYHWF